MEFHEKLQELRKSRGLTQEELAEALFVSRTAVSKWESGRGYPNIESLKMISSFFSVTIDDLLSGEKLILIAQKENKSNLQNICNLLFGMADLLSLFMILLPLYPKTVDDYVYSVNLWMYEETAVYNRTMYWMLFIGLIACGIVKILQVQLNIEKGKRLITVFSLVLSTITIFYLVLTREVYAAIVAMLLTMVKILLFFKCEKM